MREFDDQYFPMKRQNMQVIILKCSPKKLSYGGVFSIKLEAVG